jgi:GTPase
MKSKATQASPSDQKPPSSEAAKRKRSSSSATPEGKNQRKNADKSAEKSKKPKDLDAMLATALTAKTVGVQAEPEVPPESVKFAGHIAIVGRPNVGKSTLVNKLVGAKVVITSRKAQTTRHRIRGVLTQDGAQYVFVDTPGIQFKHSSALTRSMNRAAEGALSEVNCAVFVCEAAAWTPEDDKALDRIPNDLPLIVALNKVDRIGDKARLGVLLQELSSKRNFAALVPISAQNGTQLKALLREIRKHLPEQGSLFEEDSLTDRSERFIAAEYIREKLFRLLGDELPYQTAVVIDQFEEVGTLRRIFATILVEKDNQKAIVIGAKGETLRDIGSQSRRDMEKLFGGKVYLELWVKVKSGWADSEAQLRSLGME